MECLACGSEMVIRNGKHGKFWGCTNYPQCRNTERMDVLPVQGVNASRENAIRAFNRFVASKEWSQSQGQRWLESTMGLNREDARVNLFDEAKCNILMEYIKIEGMPGGKSEMALAFERAQQRRKKK